jgi:hypothetical protein
VERIIPAASWFDKQRRAACNAGMLNADSDDA